MKASDIKPGGSKEWQQRLWRREGLHKLGLKIEEYDKYLETEHWRAFRKRVFADQRRRLAHNGCERCTRNANEVELHVHHLTYERPGNERDEDV